MIRSMHRMLLLRSYFIGYQRTAILLGNYQTCQSLTSLSSIDLGSNSLSRVLPPSIKNLSTLSSLPMKIPRQTNHIYAHHIRLEGVSGQAETHLPKLQLPEEMDHLQSELQLARSVIAEKDGESHRIRVTNNQLGNH